MLCYYCGNKLEKNNIVCPECGKIVERNEYRKKINKNINIQGIISFILSVICILMCFKFMLNDISIIGMYTKIMERLYFVFDLVVAPLLLSFITLIISYSGDSDSSLNRISIFLSIVSLFMIIIEIVIVIVY